MARAGGIFDLSGGADLWDNGLAGDILSADYFTPAPPVLGENTVKVWVSGSWVAKPLKVRVGASWVDKPIKVRAGSNWV